MAAEFSFLQATPNSADLTTYTFSSENFGTADADRYIIVGIVARKAGATTTISSVTIGGVSATITAQQSNSDSNTNVAGIAIAKVPTGTSGDVVVTFGAGMVRCVISVYRAVGITGLTAYHSDTDTSSDPVGTLNIPGSGFAIGMAISNSNSSCTWTNLTEDADGTVESFVTYTSASDEFSSSETGRSITANFASSGSTPIGIFASWEYAASGVYSNGYSYRRKITIDNTKVSGTSNFTDITVPFAGTYSYLADTSNAGKVESSSGNDIRFETSTGTQIKHDLAYYDNTTGEIEAWLKIPTLDYNDDTEIYVYYGKSGAAAEEDPTNAWHSDFDSVYHLNESTDGTSGEVKDTIASNDGTGGNGTTNECPTRTAGATGITNQGQSFDPTTYQQHINFGDVHDIRTSDKTCIAFAKTGATTSNQWMVAKSAYGSVNGRWAQLGFGGDGTLTTLIQNGSTNYQPKWADSPAHNDDTWRMYASVVDRSGNLELFSDGISRATVDISSFSATDVNGTMDFIIGCYNDPDGTGRHDTYGGWNGEIDEVWILSATRDSDWQTTIKNAVLSPSTFYSVGSEETSSSVESATVNPVTTTLTPVDPTATYTQVETSAVSPLSLTLTPTTTTSTYSEIDTAGVSPLATTLTTTATTANYTQIETATVSPLATTLTPTTTTATYAQINSAAVASLALTLTQPLVTATFGATETATVSPLALTLTPTATTATSTEVYSASVAPLVITLTPQAVTATKLEVLSATTASLGMTLTDPGVTATYQEVDTVGVAPVSMLLSPTSTTASYTQVETSSVSPLQAQFTIVPVTATYAYVVEASVSPLQVVATITATSATSAQVETASVSPLLLNFLATNLTATSIEVTTASVAPIGMTLTPQAITASYLSAAEPPYFQFAVYDKNSIMIDTSPGTDYFTFTTYDKNIILVEA